MSSHKNFRKLAREWIAAALCVAAFGVTAGVILRARSQPVFRLTITAGSPQGLRHQIVERLAAESFRHGVRLRVLGTSGSDEALDRVDAGTLDLALVQGGLSLRGRDRVRQVATLHLEPLHLLVKREIQHEVSGSLEALKGRTVNLSEIGSGTYDLAREVMRFAGLDPRTDDGPGDFTATTWSYGRLMKEEDRQKLPDAVFMVSALPSPVVRHLVATHDFRLVPLSFGEAFALDTLQGPGRTLPRGKMPTGLDKSHVWNTEIPAFTYGVAPAVPDRPVATIGTRLLLVAQQDIDSRAICRIVSTIYETEFAHLARPPLDARLLDLPPEIEWHPGTLEYLVQNKPVKAGDVIESLEKGISIIGPLLGGLFFLWQWVRQRYRRQRDLGFEAYMMKVTAIERKALTLELSAMLDLKELLRLQLALSQLKSEALEKFAEGSLEGEELISGFINHVNDARNYLTRLILHERESLEKQARNQNRPAEALWFEALGESLSPAGDAIAPMHSEDLGT